MLRRVSDSWKFGGLLAGAIAGTLVAAADAPAQFGPEPIEVRRGGGVSINLPFIRVRTGGGTAVDAPFVRVRTRGYAAPAYPFAPYGGYGPEAYPYPGYPPVPYPSAASGMEQRPFAPDAPLYIPRADVPAQGGTPIRVYVDSSIPVMMPARRDDALAGGTASVRPIANPRGSLQPRLGAGSPAPLPELGTPSSSLPTPAGSVVPEIAEPLPTLVIPPLPEPKTAPATANDDRPEGDQPEETVIKKRSADRPAAATSVAPAAATADPADTVRQVAAAPVPEAAARPSAASLSYLVIPAARVEGRPRMGPIASGQAAPAGTTEYMLSPMSPADVPASFQAEAGTHLFAFRHPRTGGTVAVEVVLPAGEPRIDVAADRVAFAYPRQRVTVHFAATGGASVDYGR